MISFLLCLAILIAGYFFYGKVVENTFGPDDRETPAVRINDGVDYVVLPQWKLFMIQLLNIAGLGPIFGALSGALWGPIVFLWITFGTIFAGGVHDYFSGMLSERNDGVSISEISGIYLGKTMKNVMRVFSVVLLVMVGTVFAVGPAGLLQLLCSNAPGILSSKMFWLILILVYYFIATFLSIDKLIGKIYPVFGICLIVMAVGVGLGIFTKGYEIPEIWNNFTNMHPQGTPIWSFMFITVACGAISGFHATQSPLMARCLKSEKQGHFVFYGAMVSEGIIALIWAAAGCALYTGEELLALGGGGSTAVYDVCKKTMGGVGIALAMLGVIACPITSGDTAFRSARLVLADWFHLDQKVWKNRLLLCVPVLGIGAFLGIGNALGKIDYTIIWRYFSWTNQTLAMIVLWCASMFLFYEKKNYWITAVPATFMTAVSITYFMLGNECLGQFLNKDGYNTALAYPVGIVFAALFLGIFLYSIKKRDVKPQYETLGK
ncbi:carbon starvation protein A [Pseudoflavonifractor sp. MSJ-30]|uniref:carbon starvation CstA family protein n=1 Tax=Pseudoflavonifractor sp. MSJ-30 TaxID=2841525 RepID=UPI001C11B2B6|nr:carbon starvation CstA family protein [Pseudoflavonifractor sp. MSJ-30]MBU5453200.1 carbon starvation protein A [Pseudoflavonifractor sp. MSJ-30]